MIELTLSRQPSAVGSQLYFRTLGLIDTVSGRTKELTAEG